MHKSSSTSRFVPRGAALAVLAAALAGCSFIPTYQRPDAPVAAAFPDRPGAAAPSTATPAAEIAWQEFFPDERLRRLIGIALVNNRDLRIAALNIEQARAQFQIQRSAQFPAVGVAATGQRAPSPVNGDQINTFSVGLALSAWEIDFFGRIASLKEAALAQYLASEEGRRAGQTSLVAAVATGWLTLLADEDQLALTRQTLLTREETLRLTRLRFDNGASSEIDWRLTESLTESARASLAQLERQRALDENALALLLGQPVPADVLQSVPVAVPSGGVPGVGVGRIDAPPQPTVPVGPAPTAEASAPGTLRGGLDGAGVLPDVPAGLPADLLAYRPDIRQAEQLLLAANANIGAARAAFFPRISLTATAGRASGELSGLFSSGGAWAYTVAPQLVLPLFDAGRNQAGLDSANVSRAVAVAQYERAIQSAFREVADALAGQATLGEQARALRAQANAESVRLRLSDLRYRNGIASSLDLLDAQRSLFTAQQALVQTRAAQLQNQVALYRALGGGWTAPDTPVAGVPAVTVAPAFIAR